MYGLKGAVDSSHLQKKKNSDKKIQKYQIEKWCRKNSLWLKGSKGDNIWLHLGKKRGAEKNYC